MKNPIMLKLVPDHLKTIKVSKHAFKKLPFLIKNLIRILIVPDQYVTQQVRDKAILENGRTLKSLPDCYKNQEMCNKAVDNYAHTLEFVPQCYETLKMCDKAVDTHPSTIQFVLECCKAQEMCYNVHRCVFVYDSIPDYYETQEICNLVIYIYYFLIAYCPDKYKTQRMCDEVVMGVAS